MTKKHLDLGPVKIPVAEYASQGNAILGIRDSGKSYTATAIAEQLLEAGIPFVAFDPIGIWKYLRVPGRGKGYPVVVAGGRNGDLPLTPHSAPEIVRAAMRENIPLVIDLYSIQLSKNDWKQIVEQCIRLLLYENGDHGLRHIFIEEAAEFVPQRVGPDQGRVYAEVEKLARMGGNAQLGYTLINQRAEEVNKAVLELCDCLFLHRQKGRNSLTALGKWLDIAGVGAQLGINKSLPLLAQGECWVWTQGSDEPSRVKIPAKNSFHPDRRALQGKTVSKDFKALDVSSFVTQMSGTLEKIVEQAKANDPAELKRQVATLQKKVQQLESAKPETKTELVEVPVISDSQIARLEKLIHDHRAATARALADITETLSAARKAGEELSSALGRLKQPRPVQPPPRSTISTKPYISVGPAPTARFSVDAPVDLVRGKRAILQALARCHPMKLSLPQLARLARQSLKSSSFKAYLSDVKRVGQIAHDHDGYALTDTGMAAIDFIPSLPQTLDERIAMWRNALIAGERAIFDYIMLASPHGEWVDSDDISTGAEQSIKSSSFKAYLSNLVRNRLLEKQGIHYRPAEWLMKGE